MTDDLDLACLTDDQLVALARLVVAEAGRRKFVVQQVTRAAFIEEAERLRISQLASKAEKAVMRTEQRREAEAIARAEARLQANATSVDKAIRNRPENPQEADWQRRKMLATMVRQTLGYGWTLTVWCTRDNSDRRVYIDKGNEVNRYGGKIHPHAAYYVTGTHDGKHAPRSTKVSKIAIALKPEIAEIAVVAASLFRTVRIDCDEVVSVDVGELPIPDEYTVAYQARARVRGFEANMPNQGMAQ